MITDLYEGNATVQFSSTSEHNATFYVEYSDPEGYRMFEVQVN